MRVFRGLLLFWSLFPPTCCLLQVKLENEVPAKVSPLKPKYTLLGNVNVQAGSAVKLG